MLQVTLWFHQVEAFVQPQSDKWLKKHPIKIDHKFFFSDLFELTFIISTHKSSFYIRVEAEFVWAMRELSP